MGLVFPLLVKGQQSLTREATRRLPQIGILFVDKPHGLLHFLQAAPLAVALIRHGQAAADA
jgi:hypothetical protein